MCFAWSLKRTAIVSPNGINVWCLSWRLSVVSASWGWTCIPLGHTASGWAFRVASLCSCLSASQFHIISILLDFPFLNFIPLPLLFLSFLPFFLSFFLFSVSRHIFFCLLFLFFYFLFVLSSSSFPTQFPPLSSIIFLFLFYYLSSHYLSVSHSPLILIIYLLLSLPLLIPLFFSPSDLP